MINSIFYKHMHRNKNSVEKGIDRLKERIVEAVNENDFIQATKLSCQASELYAELKAYEDMIDEFEEEFNKEN